MVSVANRVSKVLRCFYVHRLVHLSGRSLKLDTPGDSIAWGLACVTPPVCGRERIRTQTLQEGDGDSGCPNVWPGGWAETWHRHMEEIPGTTSPQEGSPRQPISGSHLPTQTGHAVPLTDIKRAAVIPTGWDAFLNGKKKILVLINNLFLCLEQRERRWGEERDMGPLDTLCYAKSRLARTLLCCLIKGCVCSRKCIEQRKI